MAYPWSGPLEDLKNEHIESAVKLIAVGWPQHTYNI